MLIKFSCHYYYKVLETVLSHSKAQKLIKVMNKLYQEKQMNRLTIHILQRKEYRLLLK